MLTAPTPAGLSLASRGSRCGLIVTIAGDAVLYYPAGAARRWRSTSADTLTAGEIFHFGLLMTVLAPLVVLAVALPYWAPLGEPLAR